MNHPTDPITPVRALIEAAQEHKRLVASGAPYALREAAWQHIAFAACEGTASISQLLSEHEKVQEYIGELRYTGSISECKIAARLAAIVEGK